MISCEETEPGTAMYLIALVFPPPRLASRLIPDTFGLNAAFHNTKEGAPKVLITSPSPVEHGFANLSPPDITVNEVSLESDLSPTPYRVAQSNLRKSIYDICLTAPQADNVMNLVNFD